MLDQLCSSTVSRWITDRLAQGLSIRCARVECYGGIQARPNAKQGNRLICCLPLQSGGDGHKVKVAGVAVSDEAGYQGGFLNQIDWKPPA